MLRYILTGHLVLFGSVMFAHDVPVHQQITANAADTALTFSAAYAGFLSTVSGDIAIADARKSLIEGSAREDDPVSFSSPQDGGHFRSLNHFYDPLDQVYGKGLSDDIPDRRKLLGTNSFAWASVFNGFGITLSYNPNPINTWSWQNARSNQWAGLTATNQVDRITALTNMFRAMGQVMHLLEDTSQPQHVRNEQHLDKIPYLKISAPWRSPIEDYGNDHYLQLNYQHSILDWRAVGFKKLEDFWDRHLYNGVGTVLLAAENGGAQLGLAEWCNGNFLGARHMYPDHQNEYNSDGTKNIKWYPYPSLNHSTDYPQIKANFPAAVHPIGLKNGQQGSSIYVDKTDDGVKFSYLSRLTFFGASFPYTEQMTIYDDNVLKSYHDQLIPKAVEYSAGLLDYFFRGTLSATVVGYDSNLQQYTNHVINTSSNDFSGGAFYLFMQANGGRGLIQSNALIGTLASGASTNLTFSTTLPTNPFDLYLVYQGTIGITNGTPLDPADAGIAIAVAKIPDQIVFDLTWDEPMAEGDAELDFYLTDPCNITFYEPDLHTNTSDCCLVDYDEDENNADRHQRMAVTKFQDGSYQLWVNYEEPDSDTNVVNATLVTSDLLEGLPPKTNTFTLNFAASGQYNQYGWPIGVVGPAVVDTNGLPATTNASWYVRKVITVQNNKVIDY